MLTKNQSYTLNCHTEQSEVSLFNMFQILPYVRMTCPQRKYISKQQLYYYLK